MFCPAQVSGCLPRAFRWSSHPRSFITSSVLLGLCGERRAGLADARFRCPCGCQAARSDRRRAGAAGRSCRAAGVERATPAVRPVSRPGGVGHVRRPRRSPPTWPRGRQLRPSSRQSCGCRARGPLPSARSARATNMSRAARTAVVFAASKSAARCSPRSVSGGPTPPRANAPAIDAELREASLSYSISAGGFKRPLPRA